MTFSQIVSTIWQSLVSHFNFEIKLIDGRFSYHFFGSDSINWKKKEEEEKAKEEENKKVEEEKKKAEEEARKKAEEDEEEKLWEDGKDPSKWENDDWD